jgi:hypothetical protein
MTAARKHGARVQACSKPRRSSEQSVGELTERMARNRERDRKIAHLADRSREQDQEIAHLKTEIRERDRKIAHLADRSREQDQEIADLKADTAALRLLISPGAPETLDKSWRPLKAFAHAVDLHSNAIRYWHDTGKKKFGKCDWWQKRGGRVYIVTDCPSLPANLKSRYEDYKLKRSACAALQDTPAAPRGL